MMLVNPIKMLLNPILRVTVGLLMLVVSLLLVGDWLGLVPNHQKAQMEGRARFAEALAVQLSSLASGNNSPYISSTLRAVVERNTEYRWGVEINWSFRK